jgi:2-oxo-3-hexenedioate decarboxylase
MTQPTMPPLETHALAREMLSAYETGAVVAPPSARDSAFDLNAAYAVEAEYAALRRRDGHRTAGLKVGYANKAVWRVLKLDTLVWAHMYDDTVHHAGHGRAEITLPYDRSTKVEPEVVFHLDHPIPAGADAAAALQHVDWLAIGFELIDCPYPDWQFKPADFVAGFGLHLALVVGQPLAVGQDAIPGLVDRLASFRVRISKNGELVEEGGGRNSLRSPALCLAELAAALSRRPGASPLGAGDLISTGTLTAGHPVARGETWDVEVDGLPLSSLSLRLS